MNLTIRVDDLAGPEIAQLLQAHLDFASRHTPAGSGHALDLAALKRPDLTFWSAWAGDTLSGCIALRQLAGHHGEIKSMHTAAAHRGRGVASALIAHVIVEAARRGLTQLSLETGQSEGFAASRRLYAKFGFTECPPFGDYIGDAFSHCMTRQLADPASHTPIRPD